MNRINIHLLAIFIIPLLVYLFSMPLTVALEDDGIFIMSSYFNGVSHPPGYPLHSLLGKLFTLIPVSTVAARVHALSSFFGALTCVILWLLINDLLKNKLIAYVGALSFAFSTTFWSQAIIAEVYTLNTFFFFSLFYLLWKIKQLETTNATDKSRQLIYFSAFIFGLSLCNHWPLILLSSASLFILIWPSLKASPSVLFKSLPFIIAGLLPYAWMVYNSQTNPIISFAGPIDSWQILVKYIARTGYADIDSSSSAGLADKFNFLIFYLQELVKQFTYLGFLFVVLGLYAQFKYFQKPLIYALFVGFFGNSFLLLLLLNFDFEILNSAIMSVYFLISYGIASLWLSAGLYHCYILLPKNISSSLSTSKIFAIACSLLVTLIFVSNLSSNYRHNYDWASRYAHTVLNSLAKDSVLFLEGDISVGAIGYTSLIESVRPDVKLLSGRALVFRDRLYNPSLIKYKEARPIVKNYIHKEIRPVYTNDMSNNEFGNDHWLTKSFSADASNTEVILHLSSLDENYLRYIYQQQNITDAWTNFHKKQLLTSAVPFVIEAKLAGSTHELLDAVIIEIMNDLDSLVAFIKYLKARQSLAAAGGIDSLISKADALYLASTDKPPKANYLQLRATLSYEKNERKAAENYLIESINIWPNIDNVSFKMMADLYTFGGRVNEYNSLIGDFDASVIKKYHINQ